MTSFEVKDALSVIGPILSVAAGIVVGRVWDRYAERQRQRDALAIRYLSQLQNSADLLRSRLKNLLNGGGHGLMTKEYFQFTTIYALACPLAMERIFILDGVYPQLNAFSQGLSVKLESGSLDSKLVGFGFHRYDRLAVAECAMRREATGLRLASYFEFVERYKEAEQRSDEWLLSAVRFADRIESLNDRPRMEEIIQRLDVLVGILAEQTGLPVLLKR